MCTWFGSRLDVGLTLLRLLSAPGREAAALDSLVTLCLFFSAREKKKAHTDHRKELSMRKWCIQWPRQRERERERMEDLCGFVRKRGHSFGGRGELLFDHLDENITPAVELQCGARSKEPVKAELGRTPYFSPQLLPITMAQLVRHAHLQLWYIHKFLSFIGYMRVRRYFKRMQEASVQWIGPLLACSSCLCSQCKLSWVPSTDSCSWKLFSQAS